MKNSDMPAMPQSATKSGYGCNYTENFNGQVPTGLTKREMFAMNAPDMPDWFVDEWSNNHEDSAVMYSNGAFGSMKFKYEMQAVKAWRYAYADLMLED